MGIPKTQKAKGVYALTTMSSELGDATSINVPQYFLFNPEPEKDNTNANDAHGLAMISRDLLRQQTGLGEGPLGPAMPPDILGCVFARPCPKKPRHGFVDSRPVVIPRKWDAERLKETSAEMRGIYNEALAADEKAEMLVMPYIPAEFNMIATPALVAVGPGNDGATSGHESIVLPVMETTTPFRDKLNIKAGVKEYPFYEFVAYRRHQYDGVQGSRNIYYATQVRNGPKPDAAGADGRDYIPHKMVVKNVITAQGDLLSWERTTKHLAKEDGVVVYHKDGNLASHYAVHCILNKIPIVTSFEPMLGQELEPAGAHIKVSEPDHDAFLTAVAEGLSIKHNNYPVRPSDAVTLMLYAMHNAPMLDMKNPLHVRLLGYAIGSTIKLCAVACMGELRHSGFDHELLTIITDKNKDSKGRGRGEVYVDCLNWRFMELKHIAIRDTRAFGYAGWGHKPVPGGAAGVGGIKWFECATLSWDLWNAVCDFALGKAKIDGVLTALNRVVNVCHNGAKMLTKFLPSMREFNIASRDPMMIAVLAAPVAHVINSMPVIHEEDIAFERCVFPTLDDIVDAWKLANKLPAKKVAELAKKAEEMEDGDPAHDDCDCEDCNKSSDDE